MSQFPKLLSVKGSRDIFNADWLAGWAEPSMQKSGQITKTWTWSGYKAERSRKNEVKWIEFIHIVTLTHMSLARKEVPQRSGYATKT